MRSNLHLIARGLVFVRRPEQVKSLLFRRQWDWTTHQSASSTRGIHNLHCRLINNSMIKRLQSDSNRLFSDLCSHIVNSLLEPCESSHCHSMTLTTTPAPPVRPPSRMAKRRPSSIAIGAIRVALILTLSPGMTISIPSGNSHSPVTSVVRK